MFKELKIEFPVNEKREAALKRIRKGLKPYRFLHLIFGYEETCHPYTKVIRMYFKYPVFLERRIFTILIGKAPNKDNCKKIDWGDKMIKYAIIMLAIISILLSIIAVLSIIQDDDEEF